MNYADLTDEELDAALAETSSTPPVFRRHDMRALQAELDRRAPKPPTSWSMPDNVESDLDAAAAPLTPDPVVKPKVIVPPKPSPKDAYRQSLDEAGWEEDEADLIMGSEGGMPGAYATPPNPDRERQYAEDWHRREAGHAATEQYWRDVYGHNPQPSMGTTYTRDRGLTDFGGGQTAMVDGVEVPVFDLGDGKQRYRLGDVKRAQEAARDAAWRAGHRKMVEEDIAKHGHYSLKDDDPKLAPEQKAARKARRTAEGKAKDERAKWRQAQIDNANRPLTPFEQKEKQRRELRSDMARLAGGSQNLNSGNDSFFQALAMLEGVRPDAMDAQQRAMMQMMPMDPNRAQVEARQLDMAGRMAQNAVTAFLTNNPGATPEQRRAARDAADQKMREANPFKAGQQDVSQGDWHTPEATQTLATLAEQHDTGGWGTMSWEDENALAITLTKPPYNMSQPEAEAAAHAAAEKRRWYIWGARGQDNPTTGGRPTAPAEPAPPGPARNPAGPGRQID